MQVQTGSAVPPVGRLWQVPVFLMGLIAAAVAWWNQPSLPRTPAELVEAEFRAALLALEAGQADEAKNHTQIALELIDHAPDRAGDLRFILGSACLLEASQGSAAEQMEGYARARLYLQQAQQHGVSVEHSARLRFRLIQAEFHTGMDVGALAPQLEKLLQADSGDRVEGYALLVQMLLKKSPPEFDAAIRANEKLLAQAGLLDPNPARLQHGQLLLQLKRKEEARAVLARIPPEAPEYFPARHARALSSYEDERWQEAATLWEEATREGAEESVQGRQSLYQLGICYINLGRAPDALAAWQRLADRVPESEEAVAAGFQMAEAHHASGAEDRCLAAFVAALQNVDATTPNRYLELGVQRRLVEDAWSRWQEAGEFHRARELALHYRKLAAHGEADRRLAQSCAAAGQARQRQAELSPGLAAEDHQLAARQFFAEAGEAFDLVARQRDGEADYADCLWAAAENFLRAQEYSRVVVLLEKYLVLNNAAHRAEALVGLAEAHQALGQTEQAVKLLHQVVGKSGPLQGRARYLLALTTIDQGRFAEAETALRELLALPGVDPEPQEIRQAHFALGYVLHQQEHFAEASTTLEAALARYPTHPQGLQARWWLAEAYRKTAEEEAARLRTLDTASARDFYLKRKHAQYEKALAHFRQLAFDLADRQAAHPLKQEQQSLLREARFGIGDCLVQLGRHDEAVDVYEKLAENYSSQPDGVMALLNLAWCQLYPGKVDQAQRTLERCRMTLGLLMPKDFEPPYPSRLQWQQWIDALAKACQKTP
jgi:tetratricopeptide (TPR) repeat protein